MNEWLQALAAVNIMGPVPPTRILSQHFELARLPDAHCWSGL